MRAVDQLAMEFKNRSDVIEQAIRSFLQERVRILRDKKDLSILNHRADALNEEAGDVLSYQVEL